MNPQFRLISPSGDQVGVAGNSGETTEFVMQNAPEAGTYRVIVSDWAGNSAGKYVIRLAQAPQDFIIPAGDEGGPMTNGTNHEGEILFGRPRPMDLFGGCGCILSILTMAQATGRLDRNDPSDFSLLVIGWCVAGNVRSRPQNW